MRFLDAVDVSRGDGPWTRGYDLPESACGATLNVGDVCNWGDGTGATEIVASTNDGSAAPKIEPFGLEAALLRSTRCAGQNDKRLIGDSLEDSEDLAVGYVFHNGAEVGWPSPSLVHADVATVAAGADTDASVLAAVADFLALSMHRPIVHLGLSAAFTLTDEAKWALGEAGVKVSVSLGFDPSLIAVTGPVLVHIGSREDTEAYDTGLNEVRVTSNKIAAIEFDPCQAVRVA